MLKDSSFPGSERRPGLIRATPEKLPIIRMRWILNNTTAFTDSTRQLSTWDSHHNQIFILPVCISNVTLFISLYFTFYIIYSNILY
jgi:hypothetical protein